MQLPARWRSGPTANPCGGVDIPIISGDGFDGTAWVKAVPNISDLFIVVHASIFGGSDEIEQILADYESKYGSTPTGGFAITGYSTGQTIVEALKQNDGSTDGESLKAVLDVFKDFPTANGPVTLTPEVHIQLERPLPIVQFTGGEPKYVETVEPGVEVDLGSEAREQSGHDVQRGARGDAPGSPPRRRGDLAVMFGHVVALDDVTLGVERGEILGLIGPNGSGKTTMVNVVNGFLEASSGRVFLGGKDVTGARRRHGRGPAWRGRFRRCGCSGTSRSRRTSRSARWPWAARGAKRALASPPCSSRWT